MKGKKHREIQNTAYKKNNTLKHPTIRSASDKAGVTNTKVTGVHSCMADQLFSQVIPKVSTFNPIPERRCIAVFIAEDVAQSPLEAFLNTCWNQNITTLLYSEIAGRVISSEGMAYAVDGCPPLGNMGQYQALAFFGSYYGGIAHDECPRIRTFLQKAIEKELLLGYDPMNQPMMEALCGNQPSMGYPGTRHLFIGEEFFNALGGNTLELLHPVHQH